jgi:hypothetical protein
VSRYVAAVVTATAGLIKAKTDPRLEPAPGWAHASDALACAVAGARSRRREHAATTEREDRHA